MENIKVNKDACIQCGGCVAMVPDVFQFGEDDLAEVKVKKIPEELEEEVRDAMEGCPTSAIFEED